MLNRRKLFQTIIFGSTGLLWHSERANADLVLHQNRSANEFLINLIYSLWVPIGNQNYEKTIYKIGGPWCPVCAAMYRDSLAGHIKANVRYIPVGPLDKSDEDRIVDIVVNNGGDALERAFNRNLKPIANYDQNLKTFILSAQKLIMEVADQQIRYMDAGSQLQSPALFTVGNRSLNWKQGYKLETIDDFLRDADPNSISEPNISNWANEIAISNIKQENYFSLQDQNTLYLLPNQNSAKTHSVNKGRGYLASEVIEVNAEKWLAFKGFEDQKLRTYGRMKDFTN